MFFPYNPRILRLALLACSIAAVALAAWALAAARVNGELTAWARLGVALGLLGAFAWILYQVRPRAEWGVKVDPLGLTAARPLSGGPVELVWSQIAEVRRDGLLIRLKPEGRFILNRHLFADAKTFDALAREVEGRAPKLDA